jgi:hypothetical protein
MTTKFKPKTVLLIPDVHAKADDDLGRLDSLWAWLNKRASPIDKVVQIGDLWDFESLCLHDSQSPEWYRRSLEGDIDAGFKALDKIVDIARDFNVSEQNLHLTLGNHEDRYDKWMKSDNRLLTSDFPKTLRQLIGQRRPYLPLRVHAFLKPALIYGTAFSHYFVSGVMNRPHSGERPSLSMLRTHHMSVVAGHKHTADWAEHTRPDSSKIYALVAGCFVDPEGDFHYAGAGRKLWWNGCHLLHFTAPGEFDIESISLTRMTEC